MAMDRQVKWHEFKKNVSNIAIAALVGSLSFFLSQYLSRPILSIEYVDLIDNPQQIPIDSSKVLELIQAPSTKRFIESSPSFSMIMTTSMQDGQLSQSQAERLSNELDRLLSLLNENTKRIMNARAHMKGADEINKARDIAKEFLGPFFESYALATYPFAQLKSAFLNQLDSEEEANSTAREIAHSLLKSIDVAPSPVDDIIFKVQILNRGNTDGLIRNSGTLKLIKEKVEIPLKRISPPKSKNSNVFAVPTTITNLDQKFSERSVGKIEKNSMVETWFSPDSAKIGNSDLGKLMGAFSNHTLPSSILVLFDQDGGEVSFGG